MVIRLSVQLGKKYPYVAPNIELQNVRGLMNQEKEKLIHLLVSRSKECAQLGTVMVCELVQVVEDFLLVHNQDPTKLKMSAWEIMKAKEIEAQKRALEQQKEFHKGFANDDDDRHFKEEYVEASDRHNHDHSEKAKEEVEKELARQMEAFDVAAADRKKRNTGIDFGMHENSQTNRDTSNTSHQFKNEGEDDDEDWYDDEENPQASLVSSSRYKTDFIELGLLGRGGGGEVVKVRNRLDKRICKKTNAHKCIYIYIYIYMSL